ncbi:MAG: hypothetical protein CVU34_16950 [Betaproteobacteria bacterium HGW-Betaproteobacteria-7]|nr:MAG: hypothetical protein CVU34_16950 [Betaproteobacteria bacterium HGW-Betaproteobacteria-7]
MLNQAISRQRCASCQRWQGPRQPGETPDSVAIQAETDSGLCVDGGWDGDERRARSACGHWQIWSVLVRQDPLQE